MATRKQKFEWRNRVYRQGGGKDLIKALGVLPNDWEAIFDAIDDTFEGIKPTIATAVNTAYGTPCGAPLIKEFIKQWLVVKFEGGA